MKSVWEQTWEYTDFPSFERDVTTNVLIGGAWRESCVPTYYTRPEYPVGRRKTN